MKNVGARCFGHLEFGRNEPRLIGSCGGNSTVGELRWSISMMAAESFAVNVGN